MNLTLNFLLVLSNFDFVIEYFHFYLIYSVSILYYIAFIYLKFDYDFLIILPFLKFQGIFQHDLQMQVKN